MHLERHREQCTQTECTWRDSVDNACNWMHLERQREQCTPNECNRRARGSNVHQLNATGETEGAMYTNWMHLERQREQCTPTECNWRDRGSNVHQLNAPRQTVWTITYITECTWSERQDNVHKLNAHKGQCVHLFTLPISDFNPWTAECTFITYHTTSLYKKLHGHFYFHVAQHHVTTL